MLRTDNLFGKRDASAPGSSGNAPQSTAISSAGKSSASTTSSTNSLVNNHVNQHLNSPFNSHQSASKSGNVPQSQGSSDTGSKLIVGPNIKLKGVEINDCDTLVVEGRVEATMDSRVIQIAENGAFKGSAEIDLAEIRGDFDGELTVRDKLVIYASGKVSGKIRYGKLVIEEGGHISGDVQVNQVASMKDHAGPLAV
ncbi:cytoskeletal protein CcmA (bactofilin family) [Herbaspirillum sp. Sphag1AN]|uniref:bactofilin family protein n=1 Tax=unclassified Herbaspirillum TaxID=2624150 RepID=UPI00161C15D1|nr:MULTISPECIES: polymer-forming cytoskeletal protein [unclassified Herbaspirillum]MBB3213295.1 cytoskeletal protein CcmA (bactofilin family) [Herbaspirillum sp. Sphag1AN]MBB3246661.1 cytoskeletal protein CcmA (bactofilin family) [Herbaspirillum sp. Sphag64]